MFKIASVVLTTLAFCHSLIGQQAPALVPPPIPAPAPGPLPAQPADFNNLPPLVPVNQPPEKLAKLDDSMFPDGVEHDFRNLTRGAPARHSFRLVNKFGAPLQIKNVRVSMIPGGASATKFVLQPNEDGAIEVYLNTRAFLGYRSYRAWVEMEVNGQLKMAVLTFTATVQELP